MIYDTNLTRDIRKGHIVTAKMYGAIVNPICLCIDIQKIQKQNLQRKNRCHIIS